MKSVASAAACRLFRLISASSRLAVPAAILYLAATGPIEAQTTAGSIVTHRFTNFEVAAPTVVDGAGNLYSTTTVRPPAQTTPGAAQPQPGGGTCYITLPFSSIPAPCYSAYIAKTDAAGNIVFATYLGGTSASGAAAVAIDSSDNIYIAGTAGASFQTTANAANPTSTGANTSSFAAKLSADGSKFLYVTYLPACMASPSAIGVDPQGNLYIAGATFTTNDSGQHACVVKLSADGSAVAYTKILAGSDQDSPAASLA